jgi:hypothetical protein
MKLFKHVFYSWVLAIAVTLTGIFIYDLVVHMSWQPGYLFRFQLITIAIGAYLVAIPSFFIGVIFFQYIYSTGYTVYEKSLLWFIAAILSVILNVLFIPLVFAPEMIGMDLILFPWPAYAGVIAALSLRHRYFLQLFIASGQEQETSNNSEINI